MKYSPKVLFVGGYFGASMFVIDTARKKSKSFDESWKKLSIKDKFLFAIETPIITAAGLIEGIVRDF